MRIAGLAKHNCTKTWKKDEESKHCRWRWAGAPFLSHATLHASQYVRNHGWMDGWTGGRVDGWVYVSAVFVQRVYKGKNAMHAYLHADAVRRY